MGAGKRPASEEWPLSQDTHDEKRLRLASYDHDDTRIQRDSEARFEAAAVEGMLFQNYSDEFEEVQKALQYLNVGHSALYSSYPFIDEGSSSITCQSPYEALLYLKGNEKRYRRRIKHVQFTQKAVAFGPSQNGIKWKGFCNYIRRHMCIETVTIPVPYDPYPTLTAMAVEDDPIYLCETTTGIGRPLPIDTDLTTSCFQPPQLSPCELSTLRRLRHSFDWKILLYLSCSLVLGSIREIRLVYPMSIEKHIAASELKAIQAIHYHSQTFATEQLLNAPHLSKAGKDQVSARYAFNLTCARSRINGEDAIALTKKHYDRQSHHETSLLGLPRELRDRILEFASISCSSKTLHIINCPIAEQVQMEPSIKDDLSLRLVSRQIRVEASRFLFKDNTLVLACDAGDAYRYLIQMPTDILQRIKTLHFHELILLSKNRENWPRLCKLIAKQMAIREIILHAPSDPIFPDAVGDDESDGTKGNSDDEDSDEAKRRKEEKIKDILIKWFEYWRPGAKLLIQLLIQGKIANCIKLRHDSKDYLDRCGINDSAGLNKLTLLAKLRDLDDGKLDDNSLMGEAALVKTLMAMGPHVYNMLLTWYKNQNKNTITVTGNMLQFDAELGQDEEGYQVVVLTRKAARD